ncbi:MAG: phosphatase PAP2 family protein [Clostridia bacterium]|nr:phosphatase PAP2 family protein [Clostridia bacterium]
MINYFQLVENIKSKNALCKTVDYTNKILTLLNYIAYPIFIAFVYFLKPENLIQYLIFPFVSFVILSVFRKLFNAPRPYEKFGYKPIGKDKAKLGQSFPSRHVFSAFIIALMIFDFCVPVGIIFLCLSVILAITRVMCGVHFIKDVIAGMLFAILVYITMILVI